MKQVLCLLILAASCGQYALGESYLIGTPELSDSFVASVKGGYDANSCLSQIQSYPGVQKAQVFGTPYIYFTATQTGIFSVLETPCIGSVSVQNKSVPVSVQ